MSIKNFSSYSVDSGMLSIDEIINQDFTNNTKRAFLTDANTLIGAPEFFEKCNAKNIIPVIGNVITIHEDGIRQGNITLYAKNEEGYNSLKKIVSSCTVNNSKEKMTTFDKILNNTNGLIALTGGHDTVLHNHLSNENASATSKHLYDLSQCFKNDLYFEIQVNDFDKNQKINNDIINIAEKNNIDVLATNNNRMRGKAHYPLMLEKTRIVRGITNKLNKENKNRLLASDYIKKTEELKRDFTPYQGKIKPLNEFLLKFEKYDIFIPVPTVPDFPGITDKDHLFKILNTKFKTFLNKIPPEKHALYRDRLEEEVSLIKEFGFEKYFVLFDQMEKNKVEGQKFNLRGSAASFLMTNVLGLSDVDPIEHKLLSERFLNKNRLLRHELPDIDIESNNTEASRKYLVDTFGIQNTAYLSSSSRMKAKVQIEMVMRTLKKDIEENPIDQNGNERVFPQEDLDLLNKVLSGMYNYNRGKMSFEAIYENDYISKMKAKQIFNIQGDFNSKEFKNQYYKVSNLKNLEKHNPNVRKLFGLIRNANSIITKNGISYGCVVVSNEPISNLVATQFIDKDFNTDKKDIKIAVESGKLYTEKLGLIKLDILDNVYLNKLSNAYTALGLDWDGGYEAPDVYDMLSQGHTATINQIKSEPQRELAKKLGIANFKELVTFEALIRPGVTTESREEYLNNKINGVTYSHPLLEDILSPTHGILVFEEQIMEIAQKIGGMSKEESDDFRSLIKKVNGDKNKTKNKNYDLLQEKMKEFEHKALNEKNIPENIVKEASTILHNVQGYTFLKAHSLSYSALTHKQALVDVRHPAEYIQYFLLDEKMKISNSKEFSEYLDKTNAYGGRTFIGSDINRSNKGFTTIDRNETKFIDPSLDYIINNEKMVNIIIKERSKKKFNNLYDFIERTLPEFSDNGVFSSEWLENKGSDNLIYKRQVLQLIKTGAFDSIAPEECRQKGLAYTRTTLAASVDKAMDLVTDPFSPEAFEYAKIEESFTLETVKNDEKSVLGYSPTQFKEALKLKKQQSVEQAKEQDKKPRRPRP